ncbi:DUF2235 domain-containing protein [Candidatus Magnetomoraceae bacterium gMMP-1]
MSKNIIICCDGTGNEYGSYNTNVVGVFQALIRNQEQIAFYDPGVGTFDILGRTLGKKIGIYLGQAFGWGLQKNIEDAYIYLMDRYEPGDKIYLFGFSRGAFTVRSLAGMLYKCGLLQKGSKNLVPYASKIYNTHGNNKIAEGFKETYCHDCKVYFIGVWDTVASLGYFYGKNFFDAKLHGLISYGYQAASIDEKRKKFPVSLWDETRKTPNQTIEQVWFAGVHSDVGGSYKERGLSDCTLKWMLEKAEAAGMTLKPDWKKNIHPDPMDKKAQHESRKGFFWLLWPPVDRVIPENAMIHKSVIERKVAGIGYNPKNLPHNYSIVS